MPTHFEGDPGQVLALDTFIKLQRASDSFMTRIHGRGTHAELTPTQFAVMEALHHLGPMCQNTIGSKILKSSGNITMVIDNLEKNDLVCRERDANDRRMVIVSLTPAGEEVIGRIFPLHAAAICEEMSSLTPDEQRTLGALCRKLGRPAAASTREQTPSRVEDGAMS